MKGKKEWSGVEGRGVGVEWREGGGSKVEGRGVDEKKERKTRDWLKTG